MKLTATKRENISLEEVRASGSIPAVFYGKEEASTPIAVNRKEFIQAYKDGGGATIIDLEVEGDSDTKDILIREIQRHPVSDEILHVDLYVITRGEEMETTVPFEFTGTAPAESNGASVMMLMQDITVRTMPRNLPSEIVVDLETLAEVGQSITVADLAMPEGVTAVAEPEEVVATAAAEREEAEEETPSEIDMDAIEVEQKGSGEEAAEESKDSGE